MEWIRHRLPPGARARATGTLTLTFDQRCRSRLRARLDEGGEVALLLPRGEALRDGDLLAGESGSVVLVRAAAELLSVVRARDGRALARAAYHLGNRHAPVQVEAGALRFPHDHVLDEMLRALGLKVETEHGPFHAEAGAYGGARAHAHPPDHDPEHDPEHRHDAAEVEDA